MEDHDAALEEVPFYSNFLDLVCSVFHTVQQKMEDICSYGHYCV